MPPPWWADGCTETSEAFSVSFRPASKPENRISSPSGACADSVLGGTFVTPAQRHLPWTVRTVAISHLTARRTGRLTPASPTEERKLAPVCEGVEALVRKEWRPSVLILAFRSPTTRDNEIDRRAAWWLAGSENKGLAMDGWGR